MNWRTLLGTLILISSWSVQSCKDDEPIKWVDLRYKDTTKKWNTEE